MVGVDYARDQRGETTFMGTDECSGTCKFLGVDYNHTVNLSPKQKRELTGRVLSLLFFPPDN